MNELRVVASGGGAYVSESNFFQPDFQRSYWGANHARLAEIRSNMTPKASSLSITGSAQNAGPQTASPGSELPATVQSQARWSLQYQLLRFAG